MARKQNVVRMHHGLNLNIGIVIFVIIIIYVIFNLISYLTSSPVAEYEVGQGTIATNHVYHGLILRDETVVYAGQSGYINYYLKNGAKASVNDVVYSIDTSGELSRQISDAASTGDTLDPETLKEVSSELDVFRNSYDSNTFSSVYTFKNDLSAQLTQVLSQNALTSLADTISTAEANNTFYTYKPTAPGIVYYGIDGYEDVTTDSFTLDQYNNTNYEETDLTDNSTINQLDPVYKLITSENWNILINVPDNVAKSLNDKSVIKIRFCDDDYTTTVSFSLLKKDDAFFLKLNMKNSLIRYINERFTNIELVLGTDTGLKIPNSAITKKEFFTIPKDYFTASGDSDDSSLMIKDKSSGSVTIVSPTIFSQNDDFYFVDDEYLKDGDIIVKPDSSSTYRVGTDKDKLTGVYNINKGYAVFKQIKVLASNDDYTIVEAKTPYGISLYDHIALDGKSVKENQTITK